MKMIFNVGDWVTIKKRLKGETFYHTKPMKILEIIDQSVDGMEQLLRVNYDFKETTENPDAIHSAHVDFYPMRENKLKRILDDEYIK